MIRNLPAVRDALDRTTFERGATVELRDWDELDQAVNWAHNVWREESRRYRRIPNVHEHTAVFEFEQDDSHTVEFKLRFG